MDRHETAIRSAISEIERIGNPNGLKGVSREQLETALTNVYHILAMSTADETQPCEIVGFEL